MEPVTSQFLVHMLEVMDHDVAQVTIEGHDVVQDMMALAVTWYYVFV